VAPISATAAVLRAPRQIELVAVPVPEPADDEAVLEVEACGLCGTDHELWSGMLFPGYALVPGHETIGRIVSIGPDAATSWGVSVGDRVAVEVFRSCRVCEACRRGDERRCVEHGLATMYGFQPLESGCGLWGGWATHHVLGPGTLLVPVPAGLDPLTATLFNPLGAGIRWGATVPRTGPGDVVAVLGPGLRGLAAVAAARAAGAELIMITGAGDRDHPRLEAASAWGADLAVDVVDQDPVAALRGATGGRRADVVVDVTAGAPAAFGQAIALSAPAGRVVVAGTRGPVDAPGFHPDDLVAKEITVYGTLGVDHSAYVEAMALLGSHSLDLGVIDRRSEPLRRAGELVAAIAGEGDPPPHHAVLVPDEGDRA
jgi:alcohol dehydrogenase